MLCDNGVFKVATAIKGVASDITYLVAQNDCFKSVAIAERIFLYRFQILRCKEIFKVVAVVKCTCFNYPQRTVIININRLQISAIIKHIRRYNLNPAINRNLSKIVAQFKAATPVFYVVVHMNARYSCVSKCICTYCGYLFNVEISFQAVVFITAFKCRFANRCNKRNTNALKSCTISKCVFR